MSDSKISALPAVSAAADADRLPLVQGSGAAAETRRATIAQLRGALLADRAVHVRDFGAVGNGTTNDAPAIQAAVNWLKDNGGGTLLFGPRHYRVASPVVVSGVAVVLQGAGFTEGASPADGTWILVDTTGFTPFTFSGSGARGSAVRDLALRQAQPAPGAGWAPTDYGHAFRVVDCLGAVDFENVFLCAVTRGIWCDNSGRLNIQRLRGQVFKVGIEIDRCYDIPRIHHVHFWTFWSAANEVVHWQQANGDAILLRRCDGIFLDDIFALGCYSMLRLGASASGVTTKFYLGNGYADFARHGVLIEGSGVTGQIANLTTQGEHWGGGGAVSASTGLSITGGGVQVSIASLRVDAVERNAILITGDGCRLDVFSFRAERYNQVNDGSAAIHVAATATPSQVFLGAPAILGNGNGGPLINGGSVGAFGIMSPQGSQGSPGLMVGAVDTGFFSPAATSLAAVAGGQEALRLVASGTVTLGGAPGAEGLSVSAPADTVNAVAVTGAATGAGPSIAAAGADANVDLSLRAQGTTGSVRLVAGGRTVLRAEDVGGNSGVVLRGGVGAVQLLVEGSATDAELALVPKGAGAVRAAAPVQLPGYAVAGLPPAASYPGAVVHVSDGAGNKRLAISDGTTWRWPDGGAVS